MNDLANPFAGRFCELSSGGGLLYDDLGAQLSDGEARDMLLDGHTIHASDAGTASYHRILERLGFTEADVCQSITLTGDCCIAATDGKLWYLFRQCSRQPCGTGFSYFWPKCKPLKSRDDLDCQLTGSLE